MAAESRPRFHYFKGRGKGEMARLACAAAGIEIDEIYIYEREEFVKLLEDGKLLFRQIPLMEIDGLELIGSDTIVRYIGRKANLYGNTNAEKAKIDALIMGGKDLLDAGVGGYMFAEKFGQGSPEELFEKKVMPPATTKYLPAFEKTLTENGTGFLVGSSLTIADIIVFDTLTHITDSPFPKVVSLLDGYPKCKAFIEHISKQPGISEYLASPRRNPVPTAQYIKEVSTTLAW